MSRWLSALASVALALLVAPTNAGEHGGLAMVTAVAAALTIAVLVACLDHRLTASPHGVTAAGPISQERRRHGAFRRLSSPDAPGRPQPRAPGARSRPA